MRSFISFLIAVSLIYLAGCASVPGTPPDNPITKYGTISIVPALYNPETQFITFARGPLAGAIKGVGMGIGGGLDIGVEAGTATARHMNPVAGVLIGIIMMPITIPIGIAGGISMNTSEEQSELIELLIENAVKDEDMSGKLSLHLANNSIFTPQIKHGVLYGVGPAEPDQFPDYSGLIEEGIDTVLEISVTHTGFNTGGVKHNSMSLYITAQSRFIRVKDNNVIDTHQFKYSSPMRAIPAWRSNKGKYLRDALTDGYESLSNRIFQQLLEPPPYWPFYTPVQIFNLQTPVQIKNTDKDDNYCWLKPLHPKLEYKHPVTKSFLGIKSVTKVAEIKFTPISSRQPQIIWESFPRPGDLIDENEEKLSQIDQVNYDLKIWKWDGKQCDELVYERIQLPEPSHQLEEKLRANQKYCWSFRARYNFAGKPMVTGWSYSSLPMFSKNDEYATFHPIDCYIESIPNARYFKFIAPRN